MDSPCSGSVVAVEWTGQAVSSRCPCGSTCDSDATTCDTCSKKAPLSDPRVPKQFERFLNKHTNGIKYLQCDNCSFICRPLMRLFLKHYRSHFNDETYPYKEYANSCEESNAAAINEITEGDSGVTEAETCVQSGPKMKYQCERCLKAFKHRNNFCRHIKMHDRKIYNCKRCNRKFKTRMPYRAHRLRHLRQKTLLQCEICGKHFRSKDGYKYHRLHKCIQYSCHLCDEVSSSKGSLKAHLEDQHDIKLSDEQLQQITEASKSMCFICGKIIKDVNLDRHMLVHSDEKPFVCDMCGKRFKFKNALRDHIMAKLGMKDYVCEICGREFVKRCYLNKHINFHFLNKDDATSRTVADENSVPDSGQPGKQSQHSQVAPIATTVRRIRGEQQFSCDLCAKTYSSKASLRQHLLRDVICLLCDEIFISNELLKQHVLSIHRVDEYQKVAAERPNHLQTSFVYPCELCGRRFTSESRFQQHVTSETTCELCKNTFGSQNELRAHIEDHHNVAEYRKIVSLRWRKRIRLGSVDSKEYSCHLCGKKLFYKRTLLLHLRMHSGFKPYKCEYCGKAYTSKHSLNAHLISEKNQRKYVCSYCGKRYNFNADLIVHVKQRHETRQFSCHVCGKEFGLLKYLKDHSTVHTRVKPFNCDSCNVGFRLKKFLLKHNKKYHSANQVEALDDVEVVTGNQDSKTAHPIHNLV